MHQHACVNREMTGVECEREVWRDSRIRHISVRLALDGSVPHPMTVEKHMNRSSVDTSIFHRPN